LPCRPAIGLVLSGGGARGAAHVGVIRVLEELNIPIDCISGTSMGSIIGGLYASGMTADELEQALLTIDWPDAFQDEPKREHRPFRRKREEDDFLVQAAPGISDEGELKLPSGLIQGQKLGLVLKQLTLPVAKVRDFDELSIPFRAVATDIVTGHANNLPVSVARDMGADVVIVVDISTPLATRDEIKNILSITAQLTGFLTNANAERSRASLTDNDILIIPDLGEITSADFDRSGEAIPKGRLAAEEQVSQLRPLSLTGEQFTAHVAARKPRPAEPHVIDFVRIDNRSRISDDVISARLHIKTGKPLDVPSLEKDINNIYGSDLYQNVYYTIIEEEGKTGVVVTAVEKSWGPNYLQGGLALEGSFSGSNSFTIAAAYTRTALNPLGGEWRSIVQVGSERRLFTEWHQPLDVNTRWFINPIIDLEKRNVNVFDSGDKLAEYDISEYGVRLEAGRELGYWGELRGGVRWSTGDATLEIGDPALPSGKFDRGEGFLRLSLDTLNNAYFPRSGARGNIEYLAALDYLGADTEYEQLLVNISRAFPLGGRSSIILGGNFNTTLDDDAPIESLFRSGGFLRLSGFEENEIAGQHFGLLQGVYLRRINDFNLLPTYFGASLELGNAWNDTSDISWDSTLAAGSLFIGSDTFLGPIYVGYGYTEGGNQAGFLFLGNPF
jgi:NTE family protein